MSSQPPVSSLGVSTVDYHTAGEPFRIVSGGVPALRGATVAAKRLYARDHIDRFRRLVINEPRGHADMYGGFVTEPDDDGADLGVVFFHNAGYSTACGHGTIALATWAIEHGIVATTGEVTRVGIDVPSGRVEAFVKLDDRGRVLSVRFRNVPAFVAARALHVATSAGDVKCDLSFGGAYYASVRAADLGLAVTPAHLPRLIEVGREVKNALNASGAARHPSDERLSDVYGVIFYDEQSDEGGQLRQRNVTVFADGEVDRSPCGSGTSARLALLAADGLLDGARTLRHESIVGTVFTGSVIDTAEVHGNPAVITEVEGSASLTGYHQFVLRDDDPLPEGFLLR